MKTTIIIYADDDLERLKDLRRNVAIAERVADEAKSDSRRIGDTNTAETEALAAAKAAYDDLEAEAAERADAWTLSSIGHGEFRELVAKHPPRKVANEATGEGEPKQVTHPDDEMLGVDTSEFGKALLMFVDPEDDEHRTILEPTTDVGKKVKRLSAGQFDSLWIAAYYLNVGGVADPKSQRFSIAPTSNET